MSGDSWDQVLERSRRAPTPLAERLTNPPEAEGESLLPGEGTAYKAAASPSQASLTRFCCILGRDQYRPGGKPYRFFQYVHLDSDTDFGFTAEGQVITLRFAGLVPTMIVIKGRNLLRICDYIHLHRLSWIRVADRDFVEDGKEIVTSLEISTAEAIKPL